MGFEYKAVPAPRRLKKVKGVRDTPELFCTTLTDAINAEARLGWEYIRAESLVAEEPAGWFSRGREVEQTVLVFRRAVGQAQFHAAPAHRAPRDEPAADHARGEGETYARGPFRGLSASRVLPDRGGASPLRTGAERPRIEPVFGDAPRREPREPQGVLLRPVPRSDPGDKD